MPARAAVRLRASLDAAARRAATGLAAAGTSVIDGDHYRNSLDDRVALAADSELHLVHRLGRDRGRDLLAAAPIAIFTFEWIGPRSIETTLPFS